MEYAAITLLLAFAILMLSEFVTHRRAASAEEIEALERAAEKRNTEEDEFLSVHVITSPNEAGGGGFQPEAVRVEEYGRAKYVALATTKPPRKPSGGAKRACRQCYTFA